VPRGVGGAVPSNGGRKLIGIGLGVGANVMG